MYFLEMKMIVITKSNLKKLHHYTLQPAPIERPKEKT